MLEWERRHAEAIARGEASYRDPETGYRVFTDAALRARRACCGCGCRHCPWAHAQVPLEQRAKRIQRPAWLFENRPSGPPSVVSWSGGKDAFLALQSLDHRPVVLLTTFDARSRRVAHQEIDITTIVAQARALELPLLGIPLHPEQDYLAALEAGLRTLVPVHELVFGDLHLVHIRQWREDAIGPVAARLGCALRFPLWQRSYADLLARFEDSGAVARVSASPDPAALAPVRIGDRFDATMQARLPPAVDAFGEGGEFHTEVLPSSLRPFR